MVLALSLIYFGCIDIFHRVTGRRPALDGFQVGPGGTPFVWQHNV